jgi:hypothetical protein
MAPELNHSRFEGDARSQARFLEDHRQTFAGQERMGDLLPLFPLEPRRERKDPHHLFTTEIPEIQ